MVQIKQKPQIKYITQQYVIQLHTSISFPGVNNAIAIKIMKRFAATLDKQRQKILHQQYAGTYSIDRDSSIEIVNLDGGLAMTKAVLDGEDLFKTQRLGEAEGDFVALWPTGEPAVWRLAIGRPPAAPFGGCMYKFASIDPAYANGAPIDLLVFKDGNLEYGAVNKTLIRQKQKSDELVDMASVQNKYYAWHDRDTFVLLTNHSL